MSTQELFFFLPHCLSVEQRTFNLRFRLMTCLVSIQIISIQVKDISAMISDFIAINSHTHHL